MIRWLTRKPAPTIAERITAASKQLDIIRARNLAKLAEPHRQASAKGWATRRARAGQ